MASLSRRQLAAERARLFTKARRAEGTYARRLRQLAGQIGLLIKALGGDDVQLRAALANYAKTIGPWARAMAQAMLLDVSRRDESIWAARSKDMARDLRKEIQSAPTGEVFRRLMDEQVALITSLPLKAAERVHHLTIKGLEQGTRPAEIAAEIMRTGLVTKSRANLIATTEVGRAATNFTRARAEFVGSDGYLWRSVLDADVRPSHRKMEGKFVRWDSPPTLDGLTGHAGALPRCRCFPESLVPDFE